MFQGEGTVQAKAWGVYTSRERGGFEEMTAVWFGQEDREQGNLGKAKAGW